MTKYFVCRQNYWGVDDEDSHIVEIAIGGRDYANADMLSPIWVSLGEGKEFNDPREAVRAAIDICEEWKKHGRPQAKVGMGATMGFTAPFDGEEYYDLQQRAERLYEKLPKCAQCGDLLSEKNYTHPDLMDDEHFCSEVCVEKRVARMELENLHADAVAIFEDPKLDWEEKYDKIFSDEISTRVFQMIRLEYYDPDADYEDDVRAFMTAFNEKMKES